MFGGSPGDGIGIDFNSMKDNFSRGSQFYAKYRPAYPSALFSFLLELVKGRHTVWDCGTGNGQVASVLSGFFDRVYATDISRQQLNNAITKPNIQYSLQPAEKTNFSENMFDLITVAQAVHWFQFEKFYKEVNRTLKDEGIIAIMGYSLFRSNEETDSVIRDFYQNTIGPYWDKERQYLEEHYATIPFPFQEISTPPFEHTIEWKIEHLIGYLKTWSAVKHFIAKEGYDPVDNISRDLYQSFGSKSVITFPIHLRIGKI